jgi:hypothetical protein
MNHTGVWGTGSRRHARRKAESCGAVGVVGAAVVVAGVVGAGVVVAGVVGAGVVVITSIVPRAGRRASRALSQAGGTVTGAGGRRHDEEVAG